MHPVFHSLQKRRRSIAYILSFAKADYFFIQFFIAVRLRIFSFFFYTHFFPKVLLGFYLDFYRIMRQSQLLSPDLLPGTLLLSPSTIMMFLSVAAIIKSISASASCVRVGLTIISPFTLANTHFRNNFLDRNIGNRQCCRCSQDKPMHQASLPHR